VNVVVACRPEDLATEFLSVLDTVPDEPLLAVLAGRSDVLPLPRGGAADRLGAVALHLAAPTSGLPPRRAGELPALLCDAVPAYSTVWTHCPADERPDRAEVGWLTGITTVGRRVFHSVGVSSHYQFLSDVTVPLTVEQVEVKFDFLRRHAAEVSGEGHLGRPIRTEDVAACERFVLLTGGEADQLYSLLHSLDEAASVATDPWDFRHSPYEVERLTRTAQWIDRHVTSGGLLVEIGSCEGALTTVLLNAGHHVLAAEPNDRFRRRLQDAIVGRAAVVPHTVEDLLRYRSVPAAAYLLIEMLYYVQSLSVLDDVPADLLFVAVNGDEMRDRVEPWLIVSAAWEPVEQVELVAPRLDFVCGNRAYRRKDGSVGVLCRRRSGPST